MRHRGTRTERKGGKTKTERKRRQELEEEEKELEEEEEHKMNNTTQDPQKPTKAHTKGEKSKEDFQMAEASIDGKFGEEPERFQRG